MTINICVTEEVAFKMAQQIMDGLFLKHDEFDTRLGDVLEILTTIEYERKRPLLKDRAEMC